MSVIGRAMPASRGDISRLRIFVLTLAAWTIVALVSSGATAQVGWTVRAGGDLLEPRERHTATLLDDGRILVVAGLGEGGPLATAEVWGPDGAVEAGTLPADRLGHTATRLADGRVLIVGGIGADLVAMGDAYLWDPATSGFEEVEGLAVPRAFHTATTLPDGRIAIVGGFGNAGDRRVAAIEIWDPATGRFSEAGRMAQPRAFHASVATSDGGVLSVAGDTRASVLGSIETWSPEAGSTLGDAEVTPRRFFASVATADSLLMVGGSGEGSLPVLPIERLSPGGDPARIGDLETGVVSPTVSVVGDDLLLVGGLLDQGASDDERVSGDVSVISDDGSMTTVGTLAVPRARHTATVLSSGSVVILGGHLVDGPTGSVEVIDRL